jgi:hypothetical protein
MLVGKNHNFILKNISEWNIKGVIAVTVVFSLLINIGHCFQYRLNYGWGQLLTGLGWNDLTYDSYPSIVVYNFSFRVYTIVYFIVNFAVFFLVNTSVEASLLMNMRQEIAEKKERIEKEIKVSAANNSSQSEVVNRVINSKQKKIAEDAMKEKRAINMVVTNSLVNFFLRLPEILVFFSSNSSILTYLVYNQDTRNYDLNLEYTLLLFNISSAMENIAYFSYILTFAFSVLINCVFNLSATNIGKRG